MFKHPPFFLGSEISRVFLKSSGWIFMMVNVYFLTKRKRFVKTLDAIFFGDLP